MERFDPMRKPEEAFMFVFMQLFCLAKRRKAVVFSQFCFRQDCEADALQELFFP